MNLLAFSLNVCILDAISDAWKCRVLKLSLNLQMMVTGSNQSFKCLACKSSQLLQSLESLQLHFQTEHGVVNLLSTAATRAVVPPASFSCHDASCNPGEFVAGCRFCGATGLQEKEMMEHLGSRHGIVFQQDWKHYSSKHCRWASFICTGMTSFAGAMPQWSLVGERIFRQSNQN